MSLSPVVKHREHGAAHEAYHHPRARRSSLPLPSSAALAIFFAKGG